MASRPALEWVGKFGDEYTARQKIVVRNTAPVAHPPLATWMPAGCQIRPRRARLDTPPQPGPSDTILAQSQRKRMILLAYRRIWNQMGGPDRPQPGIEGSRPWGP